MTRVVLFVCTGNVCRSPMAEALFNAYARRMGDAGIFIARSAGTWSLENEPASENAVTVMKERSIDITKHRGQTVTRQMLAQAAVVITMAKSHLEALNTEFPEFRNKIHLMSELEDRVYDIHDPYGGTLEEYQQCAQELEGLVTSGYSKIKMWLSSNG